MQRMALDVLETVARKKRVAPDACLRGIERGELLQERDALVEGLVNRTTWFLRDVKGLYALADALRVRNRSDVGVWVAGCATGQEPYTLAMVLLDAGLRPRILATDISRDALRSAGEGRYRAHELTRVPERWKQSYFMSLGGGEMKVAPHVRDCIKFQHNNLALGLPAPATTWDAVVCRNVLLHFDREHAVSIIRSLHATTEYLLLSPVEQPLGWLSQTKRVDIPDGVLLRGQQAQAARATKPIGQRAQTEPLPIVQRVPVEQVSELVGKACTQLAQGALDDAIKACDAAIAGDRLFAAAHLAKGLALKRAGRLTEAVPVLRCARFLTNDEAWLAPYTLARCLERLGDREACLEAYAHALAIVDGGGAAGLSPWDTTMDAFATTVGEACRARLAALKPAAATGSAGRPR
jgi:chemotaxis protein methyltransferase CheR